MEPEKWQDPALSPASKMQRSPVYILLSLVGVGLLLVGILGYASPGILRPFGPWLQLQAAEHSTVLMVSGLVVYLINGVAGYFRAKSGS